MIAKYMPTLAAAAVKPPTVGNAAKAPVAPMKKASNVTPGANVPR